MGKTTFGRTVVCERNWWEGTRTRTARNVAESDPQSPGISQASAADGDFELPVACPGSRGGAFRGYRQVGPPSRVVRSQKKPPYPMASVDSPLGGRQDRAGGRAPSICARIPDIATLGAAMTGDVQDWAGAPFTENA